MNGTTGGVGVTMGAATSAAAAAAGAAWATKAAAGDDGQQYGAVAGMPEVHEEWLYCR
jgi:hypothetical protein